MDNALYFCDYCLKQFTEKELERCCKCTEIFCTKCVPVPYKIYEWTHLGTEVSHYCTYDCMSGDGHESYDMVG